MTVNDLSGFWVWFAAVGGALFGCALLECGYAAWRLRAERQESKLLEQEEVTR